MADPLSSLIRPNTGPQLPAFEKLAPPPPENVVLAELSARTSPGDVVIDLHGRGGWIARNAIGALRRVYACESMALTRLLAEVVLRPPDLRHFDAAIAAVAVQPRGDVELRRSLDQPFTSRCPTCGRPVIVDEFIWQSGASGEPTLTRKVYRCSFCREQTRGTEQRTAPVDEEDVRLASEMEERSQAWTTLRARLPVPTVGHSLADEVLALYTPRTIVAIEAITSRLETDLRAAPLDAALRLGVVHALLPLSRLNGYPGRIGALRIRSGRVQQPTSRAWRERNPWVAFEQGWREMRDFIAQLELGTATFQPRPGEDMEALIDGTANIVLRTGSPAQAGNEPSFSSSRPVMPGRLDPRSRVRLVLTQPPPRGTLENISFAYLATAFVLGRHAAASLPLERIFGSPARNDRGREATALRRSLLAVRPVMAREASAVVFLDRGGPSGLVAGVLGGVGAGFRLKSALLAESGSQIGGLLEFNLGRPSEEDEGEHPELADLPRARPDEPFSLNAVEQAVSQVAVSVLQARGEPASAERLLGEVLIGLDRLDHLRRLVGTQTFTETEAAAVDSQPEPAAADTETGKDGRRPAVGQAIDAVETDADAASDTDEAAEASADPSSAPDQETDAAAEPEEPPDWAVGAGSATDHVKLLMEIVMGELRRPDHGRLLEVEPGRWWLRSEKDLAQARPPLADRLEWAIYGLLSTAQELDEETFYSRIARMFSGYDTPDPDLVRAVLDSYRDPASPHVVLRPQDELAARHVEHGDLVGMLVEYGHRLGLRCHVSPRERRRNYRGGTVDDLLTDDEQRAYVPLIAAGDAQTLETTDCIWYVKGKATFLFEVEWTAMLTDPLLKRGPRIPGDETVVRFLVIPSERTDLARLKIYRSSLLRRALEEQNWHILKSDHLRRLHASDEAHLDHLAPMLGLDPEIERKAEQLALFG